MYKIKITALSLVFISVFFSLVSCFSDDADIYEPIDPADAVERSDYTSVYDMIGSRVSIDMVEENTDGLAFVTLDGVRYELGMDFLSMAMVYNTSVPKNSTKYKSEEDVYNEWYKLYIVRWNYIVAEIPLYANEYYDLYNAKIENFVTSPYWSVADAIVGASIRNGEKNSVILGSSTALSGAFRNASWGKSGPGSSDLDVQNLTTGYSTLMTDKSGTYVNNMNALSKEPEVKENGDGTKTYTISVREGLKFSDGSPIKAKNYIAYILANSTEVGVSAGGSGTAGLYYLGYEEFKAYNGKNDKSIVKQGEKDVRASKYFSGIKLIDEYTFSVTVGKEYSNYYYGYTYTAFSPTPLELYLGEFDITVDIVTKSCGIADGFYKVSEKNNASYYPMSDIIRSNLKWNSPIAYSGPYTVTGYDESALIATLKINPYYEGDLRGRASIETISYIKLETETQIDKFTKGELDVVAGITGGTETATALATVSKNPQKYAETHYARAGYGKIGFRGDFGAVQDISVRQAIMYTLNRPEFAQAFTGGYGKVVHGPYYEGFGAFIENKSEFASLLNTYNYSADEAVALLESGGWIYNSKGEKYDSERDRVRYKKLTGYALSRANLEFKSTDSRYKTVKIKGSYYMPLVVNWYGTQPNEVTNLLTTSWQSTKTATEDIGMYITYTRCDFTSGLYGEYHQLEAYGFDGIPKLSCINFATGFSSALYDYSFAWTINPTLYKDRSQYYIMDEADFYANYRKPEV
jgi:ABC-type transport system substrate-binding protein